eukprot:4518453-Amphidinium_carterae.1
MLDVVQVASPVLTRAACLRGAEAGQGKKTVSSTVPSCITEGAFVSMRGWSPPDTSHRCKQE